jgi:site-specific recombinase XerD
VLHNPASEIEMPRAERRLPRPALTVAEAELVLARPDLEDPAGIRGRAMLEVLYADGATEAGVRGHWLVVLAAQCRRMLTTCTPRGFGATRAETRRAELGLPLAAMPGSAAP